MKAKAILILLFIFIINTLFFSYSTFSQSETAIPSIMRLEQGWEYQWVDSLTEDTGIPETGWLSTDNVKELDEPRNSSEILYLRNTIPSNGWKDPALFISFMYGTFEVYQGETLVYKYGAIPETKTITYKGYNRRHFIELDAASPSNQITIRSYSNGNLIGVAGAVSIGSYSAYLTQMFQDDFDKIVIGSILVFIAFTALGFFFIKRFAGLYFGFAAMALCAALYTLSLSGSKQLIFDYSYIWIYVFQLAVYFRSAFDFFVIDKLFGPGYKKIVRRIWQLHVTLATIAFILSLVNPDFFTYTKGVFEKLSAFEVLIAFIIVIRLFLKSMEGKLFALGYMAMAGFMVRDLLVFTGVLYLDRFYLLGHIGQFALVVAVGIILIMRHREVRSFR
ncbi:hypothetical protein [Halalkalibacter urbisdiaboli]|uniref:hypothetical protein n=1 Tax=Halalkalibacter urbisdiaboli TaxID=1960589 RepID=UPI000B44E482|nr:hypothetical protein [Halalkalibacter urbisdiaboli]